MKKINVVSLCLVSALAVFLMGLKKHESGEVQSQTRFLMDTFCTIKAPGGKNALIAIGKAMDRIEEVDRKFNILNPESPLYAFNTSNTPISDPEIVDLMRVALDISKKTGGRYDVTVFPIIDAWGFFSKNPSVPSRKRLDELMKAVGYENLVIENGKLSKTNPDTKIDLGSIAKGYAVGEAVKVLKRAGITSALIDAGGDIHALGSNAGKPWKIGIRDPRGDGVIGSVDVIDKSVVTSGDYERFFENDGTRYHHIIDPLNGYPSRGTISATVISSDPVLADGWSTALFVLGADKGIPIVEKEQSIQTMMVTSAMEIRYSSGMSHTTHIVQRR